MLFIKCLIFSALGFRSQFGFQEWSFSTVRCWGERSDGFVELNVTDIGRPGQYENGHLEKWSLVLHGSSLPHDMYQERIRFVLHL